MPTLFSQALLSCIGEEREPLPREVAVLTETIRREAFGGDDRSQSCRRAAMIALAAMTGTHAGEPAVRP